MKAKEKAEELFDKYYDYLGMPDCIAKECTLIAIDEIIANIEPSISMDVIEARVNYWQEVKKEIENN